METKDIYAFSYQYLLEISSGTIEKKDIDEFISVPDTKEFASKEDTFEMLLSTLQDFQMFPNIIKYSTRKNRIKEILRFPNIAYCASLNPVELGKTFVTEFKEKKEQRWIRYSKGIVSGAKFLNRFPSFEDLKAFFDRHDESPMEREMLAVYLSSLIGNMGFALACNWLKELGYMNYSKPDTHMKDICLTLGLIHSKEDTIGCFRAMNEIASSDNVEPYRLDKVWWLICSGDFYRLGKKLANPHIHKERFLARLQEK